MKKERSPDHDDDKDAFWRVALSSHIHETNPEKAIESSDEESGEGSPSLQVYQFSPDLVFRVAPLASVSSISSPLGAQTWNASILLSVWLVATCIGPGQGMYAMDSASYQRLRELLPREVVSLLIGRRQGGDTAKPSCCILELGIGAVGLLGMVVAALLDNRGTTAENTSQAAEESEHRSSVILTDVPGHHILSNLGRNVLINKSMYPNIDINVQALDWREFDGEMIESPTLMPPRLDLVVGSELVYTEETAVKCRSIVLYMLNSNRDISVCILQVIDRPGFEADFLQFFRSKGFNVEVQTPLPAELFDMASQVVAERGAGNKKILLGGTLDRFAYGLVVIRNHI